MQADAFFSACNAGVATDGSSSLSVCGAELWAVETVNRSLAPGHMPPAPSLTLPPCLPLNTRGHIQALPVDVVL